ncbi:MAG: high-affinity branched-chain amino acid ABC transporter permease LivM [Gammaproteobacteria bacterium]|nr:high-affinity branched-chain amino acid ABC transporter permease LivM [Gammaproteobacteria bacterium]MCP5459738.1 high-affinity branched-chain amino acid ABC transporter permease LivM [Gammaproteobacteria bacterium]
MDTAVSPASISLRQAVLDALIAGVLALIVFGPISGLVLDGYSVKNELQRPLMIAGLIMLARFLLAVLMQTAFGRHTLTRLQAGRAMQVTVASVKANRYLYWLIPLAAAAALIAPFMLTKYWLTVLILALIYVLLGLGLNIVVGLAGLLDLGYVAFYAVGAYGLALGSQYLGLGFWTALPLAALTAALFGVVLGFPVLRMHGDYLAIVTLGFGEIIRLVLNNWLDFTGGPNGASAPAPTLFGLEFTRRASDGATFHEYFGLAYNPNLRYIFTYLVLFVIVCGMIVFVTRLRQMPMGRAWEALREDEVACRSLGINHVLVKLSAFAMGAMVGGIAGVFFATYQGFVNPSSFTFFESALILAIVVLGGLGSTVGVIIAALVLTILPEMLREFAEYRVLVFGILMVLMMIWRPRGLIRLKRPAYDVEGL